MQNGPNKVRIIRYTSRQSSRDSEMQSVSHNRIERHIVSSSSGYLWNPPSAAPISALTNPPSLPPNDYSERLIKAWLSGLRFLSELSDNDKTAEHLILKLNLMPSTSFLNLMQSTLFIIIIINHPLN